MNDYIKSKKINKIIKNYIYMSVLILLYGAIISFLLINWVIPTYGYLGLSLKLDYSNLFLSIFYLLIIMIFINLHKDHIKIFLLVLLLMQLIVPMLCLYSFIKEFLNHDNYILICVCSTLTISVLSLINLKSSNFYIKSKIKNKLVFLFTLITSITLIRYIAINGLKMFNLDFYKVYNYRFALRETMAGYLVYLDNWTFSVFNPFCISLSLYYKQKISLAFFFILQIILYGFSSHKSVLFTGFIVVVLYCISPYVLKNNYVLIKMGVLTNLIPVFLWMLSIKGMFCAIYYRVLFIPAMLNYYYYDYFSEHGFDWFRQSFLRNFWVSNYKLPLAQLIGLEYYGDAQISANTGFWGSGYAQGGFFVVMFYSVAIAILIMAVSSLAKKISSRLVLSLTSLPISFLYISADLPTSLLTGGILLSLFFLYLLSLEKK